VAGEWYAVRHERGALRVPHDPREIDHESARHAAGQPLTGFDASARVDAITLADLGDHVDETAAG
jgi:hypothetical protein